MALSEDLRAIPRLFGDAVEQLGKLVRNETELARAEMGEKITQAVMGGALLVGAAVLVVPVLVMLLFALAVGCQEAGVAPLVSYLIAAGVGAAVSVVLAMIGLSYLKAENLKPKVTLRQIERDVATVKELAR